jgi:A/G-specific adenine glycosylase
MVKGIIERMSTTTSVPAIPDVEAFRNLIYDHYHKHGRRLPWRLTRDPYRILVSEMMLQQTQVERVLGKYEEFVGLFPDFPSLAAAPFDQVLLAWQGLGYNRRALSLKRTAVRITEEFQEKLPPSVDLLLTLPGIGESSASAIAAFAFDMPVIFIETNIRTVFIHLFFSDRGHVRDREILPLLDRSLDRAEPRKWYYALMDYGSMLKSAGEKVHRKSTGYRRQSPFEGSDRQVRSAVLKVLLAERTVSEAALAEMLGESRERVQKVLAGLKGDGLISAREDDFTIIS